MSFQLAYPDGTAVPYIVEKTLAASQSFLVGTPLVVDTDGNFAEADADPDVIAAIAAAPCGSDTSGFNILGYKEFPSGKMQGIAVQGGVHFTAEYVGALPAADGGLYGIVKDTDNKWKVDFNEISATVVKLVGRRTTAPESILRVIVSVMPASVQTI